MKRIIFMTIVLLILLTSGCNNEAEEAVEATLQTSETATQSVTPSPQISESPEAIESTVPDDALLLDDEQTEDVEEDYSTSADDVQYTTLAEYLSSNELSYENGEIILSDEELICLMSELLPEYSFEVFEDWYVTAYTIIDPTGNDTLIYVAHAGTVEEPFSNCWISADATASADDFYKIAYAFSRIILVSYTDDEIAEKATEYLDYFTAQSTLEKGAERLDEIISDDGFNMFMDHTVISYGDIFSDKYSVEITVE